MENLKLIGAIVGLLANIPLFIAVWKGLKQNFSTWMLWTILDIITTVSLMRQHGNYDLSGIYVVTSFSMSMLLLFKKEISWELTDTLTVAGVFICLAVWYFLGDEATTIASTAAVVLSSFPLIKETFCKPDGGATKIYFYFCIASLLALIGGDDFSIKESLYPAATLGFSSVLTILSLRKNPTLKVFKSPS